MRNEQHYRVMLLQHPNSTVGVSLAAAMVYASRYGVCEPEHHATDEFSQIVRRLKSAYGEMLTVDEVSGEMDSALRSAAAAILGSITSENKKRTSPANGRKGGRPKKNAS